MVLEDDEKAAVASAENLKEEDVQKAKKSDDVPAAENEKNGTNSAEDNEPPKKLYIKLDLSLTGEKEIDNIMKNIQEISKKILEPKPDEDQEIPKVSTEPSSDAAQISNNSIDSTTGVQTEQLIDVETIESHDRDDLKKSIDTSEMRSLLEDLQNLERQLGGGISNTEKVDKQKELKTDHGDHSDELDPFYDYWKLLEELLTADVEVKLRNISKIPEIAVKLGEEATREELVPYLEKLLDSINYNRDLQLQFIELLDKMIFLIGGFDYSPVLFRMFRTLAADDEKEIHQGAITILCRLIDEVDSSTVEDFFLRFINDLLQIGWFTPICSAAHLMKACYVRVSDQHKKKIHTDMMRYCVDDTDVIVAETFIQQMADLIPDIDNDITRDYIMALFQALSTHNKVEMRCACLEWVEPLVISLNSEEVEDKLLLEVSRLSSDMAWKVRYAVAKRLLQFQKTFGTKNSATLQQILACLATDKESQIREQAAQLIINFACNLKSSQIVLDQLLPLIEQLCDDEEQVALSVAKTLTNLHNIFNINQSRQHLLPLVLAPIERAVDQTRSCNELYINNLNKMMEHIGYEHLDAAVERMLYYFIILSPTSNWRCRRDLITTVAIVARKSHVDYFTKFILKCYDTLLYDSISSIRRTAPMLLPYLIKRFGMNWCKEKLLNKIFAVTEHENYQQRMIFSFCIDQVIQPTLQTDYYRDRGSYLTNLSSNSKKLYKISYLLKLVENKFNEDWVKNVFYNNDEYMKDDLHWYAETTLHDIKKDGMNILEASNDENEETYIESLLVLVVKYVMDTLEKLSNDKIANVRNKCAVTLEKIFTIMNKLKRELFELESNEEWNGCNDDEAKVYNDEITKELNNVEECMTLKCTLKKTGQEIKKQKKDINNNVNESKSEEKAAPIVNEREIGEEIELNDNTIPPIDADDIPFENSYLILSDTVDV